MHADMLRVFAILYIRTYTCGHYHQEGAAMAVEIKACCGTWGVEKMTFASKKEADAYDKLLDTADELMTLLAGAPVALAPEQQESLAFIWPSSGISCSRYCAVEKGREFPKEDKLDTELPKGKPLKSVA